MECPDPECKAELVRITTIVKVGGAIVSIIILLLVAWNGNRLLAESRQDERISKCSQKLPAMETNVKHMTEDVKEIKLELKDMRHNLRHDTEVLHKRITESEAKILRAIKQDK